MAALGRSMTMFHITSKRYQRFTTLSTARPPGFSTSAIALAEASRSVVVLSAPKYTKTVSTFS